MSADPNSEPLGIDDVALLRLPIGISALAKTTAGLELAYGKDIYMREEPKGWLRIFRKPGWENK